MGYRIDYQSVATPPKQRKRSLPFLIFSGCLLAALLFSIVLKDERTILLRILFPGDVAVTMASLDNMLTQMKDGMPFVDAFQNFCTQVILG